MPDSGGGSQTAISKTASTIVRNTNTAAAANHANGSALKTGPVTGDPSFTHTATTDASVKITGETQINYCYYYYAIRSPKSSFPRFFFFAFGTFNNTRSQ